MKKDDLHQFFLDEDLSVEEGGSHGDDELVCPACNFALEDCARVSRLGCPECYDVFEEHLLNRIEASHVGTEHTGKVLDVPRDKKFLEKKIKQIQIDLDFAIENESFEEAIALRDDLKKYKMEHANL